MTFRQQISGQFFPPVLPTDMLRRNNSAEDCRTKNSPETCILRQK
jgi:hypothetical protein